VTLFMHNDMIEVCVCSMIGRCTVCTRYASLLDTKNLKCYKSLPWGAGRAVFDQTVLHLYDIMVVPIGEVQIFPVALRVRHIFLLCSPVSILRI
jgi:hypothetical protein